MCCGYDGSPCGGGINGDDGAGGGGDGAVGVLIKLCVGEVHDDGYSAGGGDAVLSEC